MKLTDLKPGDVLIPTAEFGCMAIGQEYNVHFDSDDKPFLLCRAGRHTMDGDLDNNLNLVGFTRKE